MYKLCVFAGTTEGRELIEFLSTQPVLVIACVATEYGEALLKPSENLTISAGRMTQSDMEQMLQKERFDLVVDATHPYAPVVTENIAEACATTGTEYLRLLREGGDVPAGAVFVADIADAVDYLNGTEGNILLTTGSKELVQYTNISDFSNRAYARVLPMLDSLKVCEFVGLKGAHVLAMQGPFSKEMNVAMLRAVDAAFMVTKETGHAGRFAEKAAAAKEAGATLVVVGRPPQRDGVSFSQTLRVLCDRFDLTYKPKVSVVGIGPGSQKAITEEVRCAVNQAECLIGAKRMLHAVAHENQAVYDAIAPNEIARIIKEYWEYGRFTVVMSGDTGFFSGTKKLLPLLDNCDVTILPGISSLSYLCSRLGTSYEDVVVVSMHGRNLDVAADVRRNPRIFVLVGGENGVGKLCQMLTEAGLGYVTVSVGERLSYPDEAITIGSAQELSERTFQSLSAVLIENHGVSQIVTHGIPDEAFIRGTGDDGVIPMTKSEVRSICLSKLQLTKDAVCWDVGAGTGSVAIEMAMQAERGQVYAIERKDTALNLLRENCQRFVARNVAVIPGTAPDACRELPTPTHAFIGGSTGNMKEIIGLLLEKNPAVRIVATAIALESIAELTDCMKSFSFSQIEVVSLSVARDKKAGSYHLMSGQNPIYIFTMQAGGTK